MEVTKFRQLARSLALAALLIHAAPAAAQRSLTLAEAVAAALAFAPGTAVARADSAAAHADVLSARAFPNPNLNLSYSKSVPRHHLELEQPLEYPWVRAPRIGAARTAAEASSLLVSAERATVRYNAEVAYVRAAAAHAVLNLSRQNSRDAQDLLDIARARLDAGDASELDVELATLTASQVRSALLSDSLLALNTIFDLQTLMGLTTDEVTVVLADSLATLALPSPPSRTALRLEAARLQLEAQNEQLSFTRRNRLPAPSILFGFEHGDPGEPGLLPTVGVSVPLPIFDRGGGQVARARADADRAFAEYEIIEGDTHNALATAQRDYDLGRQRLELDRTMMASAGRVSSLSLTAYRGGAYPLATVLEAQRSARDATRQYVDDLETTLTARAALLLAQTAGGLTP